MTPQSVHQFGGFRVQGRTEQQARQITDGARAVVEAGAYAIVLETMPATLGAELTRTLSVPTIGIGAGPGCDGQVLVMHDLLGLSDGFNARFVRRYAELGKETERAFSAYAADVRAGRFPSVDESYE